MSARRLLLALCLTTLAPALPARAALITWEVEGRVVDLFAFNRVDPPGATEAARLSSLGIEVGTSVSAVVIFDSDAPEAGDTSTYPSAIPVFEVSMGLYEVSQVADPGAGYIGARPDTLPGLSIYFLQSQGLSDPTLGSPILTLAFLSDFPGALDGTSILVDPPALDALHPYDLTELQETVGWTTGLELYFPNAVVEIELESVVRVPEPAAAWIAAVALGLLALRRRLTS